MELWDVYDSTFRRTGKVHQRGIPLAPGEFHLIVNIIPVNSKGELLIQKRSDNVAINPGLWAFTGGSAVAGEDAWDACQRELMEEVGIRAKKENSELLYLIKRKDRFATIWIVRADIKDEALILQKEEVAEAHWAKPDEIRELINRGVFHPYEFIDWMFDYLHINK